MASLIMPVRRLKIAHYVDGMIMKFSLVASKLFHRLKLNRQKNKINRKKDDSMNNQAVDQYLCAIWQKYQESSKEEKGKLLDHAEFVTNRSRDHLIRRLSVELLLEVPRAESTGRPEVYNKQELLPHIRYLWGQMEYISLRRMKAAFKGWLPRYESCPVHLKMQLNKISASQLDRYLRELRNERRAQKELSTTSPARYMKNKVPINTLVNTLDARITKPGYTQTDPVAHCGSSALGSFINSLTVTDVFSTWTENRALFRKQGREVRNCLRDIEKNLPFKLLGINVDSGSEFLNKHMLHFTNAGNRVAFLRSRPYQKNDNCNKEQKNFIHVRELFGYERFEDEALVALMNEIYTLYSNPLQNFFLPTFKLKKIRIGARIKKTYDPPKTPFQRLMESNHLTEKQKDDLLRKKLALNPFELKANLEKKLNNCLTIMCNCEDF